MLEPLSILSDNSQAIIDTIIIKMNEDDKHNQYHTLSYLKKLVHDDHEQLLQLMQLTSKPENISLLQMVMQNGHYDAVAFIIDEAMKTEPTQQALIYHLTHRDAYQRSLLHWVAQLNTDAVAKCLDLILQACQQLGLPDQVNAKENVYGATPLMMATKQGALANIAVLLKHGADMTAKSNDHETVLDLIKYLDPKRSIATMKYFVLHTDFGGAFFAERHGPIFHEKHINVDHILTTIIAIDLDTALPHDLAQLSALQLLTKNILTAENINEINLILPSYIQIDFVKALRAYKTQIKDDKNALLNDLCDTTISMSDKYHLSEDMTAVLMEAAFLILFQLPTAHNAAFQLYSQLIKDAPLIALEGFHKINTLYLDKDNQFLLIRNMVLAKAYQHLLESASMESFGYMGYLLDKTYLFSTHKEKNGSRQQIQLFIDRLNCVSNQEDLQTCLDSLTDNKKLSDECYEILNDTSIEFSSPSFCVSQ